MLIMPRDDQKALLESLEIQGRTINELCKDLVGWEVPQDTLVQASIHLNTIMATARVMVMNIDKRLDHIIENDLDNG